MRFTIPAAAMEFTISDELLELKELT